MIQTRFVRRAVLFLFLLLLSPGLRIGQAQRSKTPLRYLYDGTDVFIPNRPEMVCGGDASAIWWPNGEYAVAVRDAAPLVLPGQAPAVAPVSVVVWYNGIRRARTIWSDRLSDFSDQSGGIAFPKTETGLLHVTGRDANGAPVSHLLLLELAKERTQEIPASRDAELYPNPTLPVVLIHDTATNGQTGEPLYALRRLLRANGVLQNLPELPDPKASSVGESWSENGKTLYVTVLGPRDAKRKLTYVYYAFDLVGSAWKQMDSIPKEGRVAPPAKREGLRIELTDSTVERDGVKKKVQSAWLETDAKTGPRRLLISADCEEAALSPKGDAVLYRTQEGVFVLPLTRVPAAAFTDVLRAIAISNAKQVGLGLIMYVQDYDETFPLAEFDFSQVVNPYVHNSEVFEGFTYSYPGKTLAEIKEAAETIVGTVRGPGGEAVIYADGHVKWRDKP